LTFDLILKERQRTWEADTGTAATIRI